MKFAVILLVMFTGPALLGEGSEVLGREQTDWYSRGIIRQQTINATSTRQKKQRAAQKRKKRKAHTTRHRPKAPNVAQS